jgi:hypothetical protein
MAVVIEVLAEVATIVVADMVETMESKDRIISQRVISSVMMRSLFAILVMLMLVSCGGSKHSVEVHDNKRSLWSEPQEFYFDNTDSLSRRDISIVVRYGSGYVADSVALSILCVSPDSLVTEEPFTLHIPHLADMRPEVETFPYRSNVVLRVKGSYMFRLTPLSEVDGIASVGLVISE